MPQPPFDAPRVAFLGLCERATNVREGHPVLWRHSLIGLRQAVLNYFYPSSLHGWSLVLACYEPVPLGEIHVRLIDEHGEQLFWLRFAWGETTEDQRGNSREQRTWRMASSGPAWYIQLQPLTDLMLKRAGTVRVMLRTGEAVEEVCIGSFACALIDPPPLTEDRIAAIRADPNAGKYVRMVLGCKACPTKLTVMTGIERPKDLDGKEKVWYTEAPDEWRCACGASVVDLTSVRRNLHGALGRTLRADAEEEVELGVVRMYEKDALADVCGEFGALLDDTPPEEEVQQFLTDRPVFLHQFSPVRIKSKAPILTKYVSDFAILDARGVLVLVELERPGIKLLKRDGDVSQDLQHAFDQARRWLDTTRRYWGAALECMGFKEAEVARAKAVVIAGRDTGYPSEHLMRLKGDDHGEVDFYTYDDLLEATVHLARGLEPRRRRPTPAAGGSGSARRRRRGPGGRGG